MPFQPGNRANPGGRPKVVQYHLEKFRRDRDLDALREALLEIALKDEDSRNRISAITAYFDRAYGKPSQAITGEDGGDVKVTVTDGLVQAIKRLAEDK